MSTRARTFKAPKKMPLLALHGRILLPGGIMHVNTTHDDEHALLAEHLFWNNSLENPKIIGTKMGMCESGMMPRGFSLKKE